ncbi:hypothetical protein QTO34_006449 [Cnephaeus nilssonii]|uniref:Uncharacterized protein n=1 Tax=Cnephaeus nilssonii TaxID=3371016 RepID=A0AA40HKJ6_CNENI|nr:hypothetical protein QTO34_006449 [Eptesicus nilssonii]
MGPATPPGVPIAPGTPGSGGMGPATGHRHLELLNDGYATWSPAPSLLPAQLRSNKSQHSLKPRHSPEESPIFNSMKTESKSLGVREVRRQSLRLAAATETKKPPTP